MDNKKIVILAVLIILVIAIIAVFSKKNNIKSSTDNSTKIESNEDTGAPDISDKLDMNEQSESVILDMYEETPNGYMYKY